MSDTRTEVDAAAELATEPNVYPITPGDRTIVALPPGWTAERYDEERTLDRPHRPSGSSVVHSADGFVAAVTRRGLAGQAPTIYADADQLDLVTILNDDDGDQAGWRDYRIGLCLRRTPEWEHWRGADGRLRDQEAFAEHIEDGLKELRSPDAATMLEVAQTFHATTASTMKSGHRLASGAVQFRYEEEGAATAGQDGTLAVPEVLELALRPFVGSDLYAVTARFRFRLNRGALTLGYKLDRPHEVERAAFDGVVVSVTERIPDATVIAGPAPAPA